MPNLLEAARASLDSALPATIATVDAAGVPNVSYLSRVVYVDEEHVALTNQFFRKTRANLEANPHALLMIVDPANCAQFQLAVEFEGSRTDGVLFEKLALELEAIATITGMTGVFELKSADVFRVLSCVQLPMSAAPAEE